jgi:hypothetical protein
MAQAVLGGADWESFMGDQFGASHAERSRVLSLTLGCLQASRSACVLLSC